MMPNRIERVMPVHRSMIMDKLRRHPSQVSEITFTNIYAWNVATPVWFIVVDDALTFLVHPRGGTDHFCVLGPPVGPWPGAQRVADAVPGLEGWFRADGAAAARLRAEGLDVVPDVANSDYVYRVYDLAELPGASYHAKRNLIRQCLDSYRCSYEPITISNLDECVNLQERWCLARGCGRDQALCHENAAVHESLAHFVEFELTGGLIRVDGVVQAFALAEQLAPGVAVWHFEKALPEIRGLGQLITHWFAREALGGYEFVNREQDLGLPGLHQAKRSWNPHHMVDKFSACYGGMVMPEQPAPCLVDEV